MRWKINTHILQPYIVKALFSDPNPPVRLAKMVLGDPAFGSNAEFKTMPTVSAVSFPHIRSLICLDS